MPKVTEKEFEKQVEQLAKCPGNEVFLWKPSDWEEIVGVLKPVSLNINKDGGAE